MPCRDGMTAFPLTRRETLQVGVGMFGLSLPQYLQAAQAGNGRRGSRDVSCICLFLAGGPSHYETWDPKPHARDGIRGIWNPISRRRSGTPVPDFNVTVRLLPHLRAKVGAELPP